MKTRMLLLLLLLLLTACASEDDGLQFTQLRGEAVQNAAIVSRVVTTLAKQCADTSYRKEIHSGIAAWYSKNGDYLVAAERYHRDFIAAIVEKKGNINARQMEDALRNDITTRSGGIAKKLLGSGEPEQQCQRVASALDAGKFDLEKSGDFYLALQELAQWYAQQPAEAGN